MAFDLLLCHQSACVQECPIDQKQGQAHPERQSFGQWQPPSHGETTSSQIIPICDDKTEKNIFENIILYTKHGQKLMENYRLSKC